MILHGDNMEVLKDFPDNSIDAIVTDPPYGLSFMGKKWDYDVPTKAFWIEALRVLKPGAHVLSFGGTRTYHRLVVNMEDAGFEIRDQIMWLYGSGFPKSLNVGKQIAEFEGWGTALKPANEPIVLARKPLSESTVAKNVLKWGTGAINVDASRITGGKMDPRVGKGISYGDGTGSTKFGQIKTNMIAGSPDGRWPANVLFDESAAEMLDEQSGQSKGDSPNRKPRKNKGTGNNCFGDYGQIEYTKTLTDSGGASRFFYVAKTSKRERNAGCEINGHPTVKPIKLMEYLCRLITPPGGVILDPFVGSGSTGCAAAKLGFSFVGIEMSQEYFNIAEKRYAHYSDKYKKAE